MDIRWGRVAGGALLLELLLMITLTPLSLIGRTVFLTAVPIGVLVLGYLVSRWVLRRVRQDRLANGALLGVIATALYFGLVAAAPGGFQAAVDTYGAPLFWFCQALRVAGTVAGAAGRAR
jgi:hypothetical protein